MKAMTLESLAPLADNPTPLTLRDVPTPVPGDDEVLIRVKACGVCHTELDEIEGRLPPPRLPVIPGHQAIGVVIARGPKAGRYELGERVGVGWIHGSDGSERENLSPAFVATGKDVNGGYAEMMTVGERYAHRIPASLETFEAAPLLCAGGVGYRALRLCELVDGDVLGLTGFGGSGHLVLQAAKHLYPNSAVFVFARSPAERAFALELGADWAGDTGDLPPSAPHAIIDTTPAWRPVLAALSRLRPGGRLVINAIRKEDGDRQLLADIDYADQLWREKTLTTVANVTGPDIAEFLAVAARADIRPAVEIYPLADANAALAALRNRDIRGAKVLAID